MRNLPAIAIFSLVIVMIGLIIWYSIYFSENCLKSHITYTQSYHYHCWSWYKSTCMSWTVTTSNDPHVICDEWKHGTN